MHISSTEDFEDPRKSPWRLVSTPDDNFQKKAVKPGAIPTGIAPCERNSQFQSLDRSSQLDVRPNLKRTSVDAWAVGQVVDLMVVSWEVLGSNRDDCCFLEGIG